MTPRKTKQTNKRTSATDSETGTEDQETTKTPVSKQSAFDNTLYLKKLRKAHEHVKSRQTKK